MKYLNVFTKREFEQNGERKVKFYCVGKFKETENGGRYLRLFWKPETEFFLFPQEDKEE